MPYYAADPDFSLDEPGDEPTPIRQREPRETRRKAGRPRKPKWEKIRDEIRPDIEQYVGIISLGLTPFSPTAAEFNEARIDRTLDDISRLCERHPRLLDIVKSGSEFTAYIGLFELFAGIALAVGIDRGSIDPNFVVARVLNVTDAYERARQSEASTDDTQEQPSTLLERTSIVS